MVKRFLIAKLGTFLCEAVALLFYPLAHRVHLYLICRGLMLLLANLDSHHLVQSHDNLCWVPARKVWFAEFSIDDVSFFKLSRKAIVIWVISCVVVRTANLGFDRLLKVYKSLLAVVANAIDFLLCDEVLVSWRNSRPIDCHVFKEFLVGWGNREAGALKRKSFNQTHYRLILLEL